MIQVQLIDGALLREMLIAGAAELEKNREKVDALNVFPVPDGDTGTNMTLTMNNAIKEMASRECSKAFEVAAAASKGALRGARGNSGVITSQLMRGFSRYLDGVEQISPVQFAKALKSGADMAYKAVMRPKEGTILTVARVIAEEAIKQAEAEPENYEALMNTILQAGENILNKTPEMLPVLKEAGVVDAGGYGLLRIYRGYAAAMGGEFVEAKPAEQSNANLDTAEFIDDHNAIEELKFGYHTEFTVQNIREDAKMTDITTFRRHLNRIGDRVHIVGDLTRLNVHVHSNDPGRALQYGMGLGELIEIKVENMIQQRRDDEQRTAKREPPKKYGMVAVAQGAGFSALLKDLNVDVVVEGGQTMNPSIQDISNAISCINAENIFVLPNNGNVILAAQQAAELSDKHVFVLPTKNVAMGIAAVVAFQPDVTPEENAAAMDEASQRVRTGMITYAVRDSDFEGMHIEQGDIIGLQNGKVTFRSKEVREVALSLMNAIVTEDDSLITVYFGADTKEEDAQALAAELEELYPDCTVETLSGGQPLYFYLLSVE